MNSVSPEGTADAADGSAPLGERAVPSPVPAGRRRRRRRRDPVDIERHCGVVFPDGRQCGAALTCRRHSMSAKRAVAGRSAPFDVLLSASLEQRR
ncbi:uncharacterized protein CTRU02_209762 [Colletotrichum truncatum]|uniref:Uncharacterized protein n=1 Tax=Colletotrichum truncatum TaxID=5467 RepID=A0ACC3YTG1_COLTU